MGGDRHFLPARLRPDGERERQHRHARRRASERAVRDCLRHHLAHAFLSVRDHRVRRQRDRSRRHERLRPDRPRDLRLRQGYRARPLRRRAGRCLAGLSCGSARHVRRLDHALGRQGNDRPSDSRLLPVAVSAVRDSEHPHDERAAVRARDDAAIDDGVLHRCGRTGVRLSHHHQHPRAEGRVPPHFRAVRAAWRRRFAGHDALLDPVRDEQQAGRSGRYGAVQPRPGDCAGLAVPRLHPVALLHDRAGPVEAQASQARETRSARGEGRRRRAAPRWRQRHCSGSPAVALDAIHDSAAGRGAAGADQPRPDRPFAVRDRQHGGVPVARPVDSTGRRSIRHCRRRSPASWSAFRRSC